MINVTPEARDACLAKRKAIYDRAPAIGLAGFRNERDGLPAPEAFKHWTHDERDAYFAGAMQAVEKKRGTEWRRTEPLGF